MQLSDRENRWLYGWKNLRRIGNHDFCPGLNRYAYWLKQPIGWFVSAAVVAMLLGLFGEAEAFAVAAVLIGLILLGMIWPWVAVQCVSAKLNWRRRRCEEGENLETTLDIVNRWPWSVWGLVVESDDAVVNGGEGQKESVSLASVPALSKSRFVWQATPQKRGEYPQRSSYLASGFPFGLWMARRPLVVEQSILVWPKTLDLGDLPSLGGSERSVVGTYIDRAGMDGDVIGVRPYRDGDSLRHVHWAQSARHDSLVVCERQSIARRNLHLEILPIAVESIGPSFDELREWFLRIGGSVARTFLSHHWSVQLKAERLNIQAEPGTQGLHRMLDELARMKWSSEVGGLAASATLDHRPGKAVNGNALRVAIADAATYRRYSLIDHFRLFRWIVVDRMHESSQELSSAKNVWFAIDVEQPIWSQLRSHWTGLCRKSLSPTTRTIHCLCDAE